MDKYSLRLFYFILFYFAFFFFNFGLVMRRPSVDLLNQFFPTGSQSFPQVLSPPPQADILPPLSSCKSCGLNSLGILCPVKTPVIQQTLNPTTDTVYISS